MLELVRSMCFGDALTFCLIKYVILAVVCR